MTSNQINAKSVDESIRHNQAYEQETERHNRAVEELEERKLGVQDWYNRESLRLTEMYNEAQIRWKDDEIRLEEELREIQRQQADTDERYKDSMSAINKEQNQITSEYNTNIKEKWKIDQEIESRKVDYQKYAVDQQQAYNYDYLALQRDLYSQTVWRDTQDLLMRSKELSNAEWNLNIKNKELQLAQSQFEFTRTQWDTQKSLVEAQTDYTKANRFNVNVMSFQELNPFKLNRESSQLLSNTIKLMF